MPINQPTAIFFLSIENHLCKKSEASPTKASRISFSVITLENTIHLKQMHNVIPCFLKVF
jgi:hypothetical protein